jgi:acyl carrier protein
LSIKDIFIKITGIDEAALTESISRDSFSGWDSFNHLLLIMELENATNIKIPSSKAAEIQTFGELIKIYGVEK